MGKIKYIKIKDINKNAKEVSKKIDKSSFKVKMDIIKCIFKYGSSVKNYTDLEFYLLNDKERSTYLTDWYLEIIKNKYCNNDIFNDKTYIYNLFKEYIHRDFLDLRTASFKEFKEFIMKKEKVIVRCINGNETEVLFIDKSKLKNEYNVLKIYNNIIKKEQFIIEDYIKLDKDKTIYSDNIRIICFIRNNKVNILECTLKNGEKYAIINKDGEIIIPFIENDNLIHEDIIGIKIPNYNKIIEFINKISKKLTNINYVNFDIALQDNNLILVDINNELKSIQTKSSITGKKNGNLETYKKYMEI